jgi:hypothetical protein
MLADVLLLSPEELPAIDDLTLSYENLEELLDPKLLIGYAFKLCKHGGQAWCENVFTLWTSALLSLSSSQVGVSEKTNIPWFVFSVYILLNSIKLQYISMLRRFQVNAMEGHIGPTLLHRCLRLLQGLHEADDLMRAADPDFANRGPRSYEDFYDKLWPGDAFEDFLHKTFALMTIELVRQKADPQRVEESFLHMNKETVKSDVWKLVQGHSCGCNQRSCTRSALRFGLGADLLMALIERGLPRCCWAGCWGPFNDNLLQHIIAPVAAEPSGWDQEEAAKARLHIPGRKIQLGRAMPSIHGWQHCAWAC